MLRTETVSPELLKTLHELMVMDSLQNFRLVGGTALSMQLGHRQSVDIDMFTSSDFLKDEVSSELIENFNIKGKVKLMGDTMIRTITNDGVKIDIVNNKSPFIRDIICKDGIRMAHLEDIAAMKIKIICDPFTGRKTKKDLADVATLLDKFSIRKMAGFFKEKYPGMAPYEENVIIRLKDFDSAENSDLPKMLNGMTWEVIKHKIEAGLKEYFDDILKEREKKLKGQ